MPDRGFVISFTDVTAERDAARALSEANETLEARVASRTLELEDALAAAERANASRTRFVAAASHDLLQPLRPPSSSCRRSRTTSAARAGARSLPRRRTRSSVQDIIEALLDISRLEFGPARPDVAAVDLGALLAQLGDEFARWPRQQGPRLRVVPSALRVVSDPTYMRRILQNLIGNAIRYTRRAGCWSARGGAGAVRDRRLGHRPRHPRGRAGDRLQGVPPPRPAAPRPARGWGSGLAIVDRACAMLGHPLELVFDRRDAAPAFA